MFAVGCCLVVGCASSDAAGPACKEAVYCPGCGAFCGADCPKTDQGDCKACGKKPADVKACDLTWFWCKSHTAWHADRPCGENDKSKCCEAAKPSVALCLPADAKGIEKAKYCPACRCFCGSECPLDDKGNCKQCARPPVTMAVLAGTWHWCGEHKKWHEGAACGDHAAKKCCTETKARVLVCHP
jgi:hypothetical protein